MKKELTEATIPECKSKFNLNYHITYAHNCQETVGFVDKDVLEVGGRLPKEFVFDYLNPRSWTSVDPVFPVGEQSSDENYRQHLLAVEDLSEKHHNQYDLIFSIAAFEHISKFPLALDKMFNCLRPSGKLFAIFAPIWSSYKGHHIPEIIDKQGNLFNFNNSPIPVWGHLLMKPPEMYKYLLDYTDRETAGLITYYVYNDNSINRFFTEDYVDFFEQSPFTIAWLEAYCENPITEELEASLKQLYPRNSKFDNEGILVVLEKTI